MRRVDGRRARRKTQGSDARSEDIARGSSVNPKEGRRGRRPARSATRPRPLNLHNENPSLSLSGSSPVRTRKRRYQWSDGITAVFPARFARYQCSGAITAAFPARFARDQWSVSILRPSSNRQIRNRNEISYATARPRARASGIEKEFRAGRWSRQTRKQKWPIFIDEIEKGIDSAPQQ